MNERIIGDMKQWMPLTDIWNEYSERLDKIDSADLAEEIVYPPNLFMGEGEKEDIKLFVASRMEEMVEQVQSNGGFNLHWLSGALFKCVITGMNWERQRIGR
jgi:hypothetical protein